MFYCDVDDRMMWMREGGGLAWTMTFGLTGIMRARHLFCHRPPTPVHCNALHSTTLHCTSALLAAFTMDYTPVCTLSYVIHLPLHPQQDCKLLLGHFAAQRVRLLCHCASCIELHGTGCMMPCHLYFTSAYYYLLSLFNWIGL